MSAGPDRSPAILRGEEMTSYYISYAVTCGILVAGLAIVLHWAGDVFLHDAFPARPDLAGAVARLLDIGYYMVSAGYIAVTFRSWVRFDTAMDVVDVIATKAGFFLLLLGFLHTVNILILAVFRGRRDVANSPAVS
jgi:hypothetical protein